MLDDLFEQLLVTELSLHRLVVEEAPWRDGDVVVACEPDRELQRQFLECRQRGARAHALGPATNQQTPLQLVDLDAAMPAWGRFPGRWSEGELLWIGRTPTRFTRVRSGLGPANPRWNTTSVPALWHTDSS
jgi:hypothetical protein